MQSGSFPCVVGARLALVVTLRLCWTFVMLAQASRCIWSALLLMNQLDSQPWSLNRLPVARHGPVAPPSSPRLNRQWVHQTHSKRRGHQQVVAVFEKLTQILVAGATVDVPQMMHCTVNLGRTVKNGETHGKVVFEKSSQNSKGVFRGFDPAPVLLGRRVRLLRKFHRANRAQFLFLCQVFRPTRCRRALCVSVLVRHA